MLLASEYRGNPKRVKPLCNVSNTDRADTNRVEHSLNSMLWAKIANSLVTSPTLNQARTAGTIQTQEGNIFRSNRKTDSPNSDKGMVALVYLRAMSIDEAPDAGD